MAEATISGYFGATDMTSIFCLSIALVVATGDDPSKTMTGTVQDAAGKAIVGAHVFVRTAAPRKGLGVLCPSCYPDCRKSAVSDASGRFTLQGLDPELKFRLLMIAPGFKPSYSPNFLEPGTDMAVVVLVPDNINAHTPGRTVFGRVVDENGNPVANATVEPQAVARTRKSPPFRTDFYGVVGELPLTVTDDNGEFRLQAEREGDALHLLISSPYMAPTKTKPLASGNKTIHEIQLGVGVTVTGKIVKNGRFLAGVGVGMIEVNRKLNNYTGHFEVGTDTNGRFEFANMAPGQNWYIYGLMDTLKETGAIPARTLMTGQLGSIVDLGALEVQSGFRIEGHMELSDGKPIPPDTRMVVSRDDSGPWDAQVVTVGANGRFVFEGVPPERVMITTKVNGYHLSPKIESLDRLYRMLLRGTVKGNVDDLRILLDPGPNPAVDFKGFTQEDKAENELRQSSPLRGATLDE